MKIAGPWPSKQTCYGLQKKWPLLTHWRNWKKHSVFSKKKPSMSLPNFKSKCCFYHWKWGKEAKRCQNPCAWPNKRAGQPQVMAAVAGLNDSLIFVLDKMTKRSFLVDTGAEVSVVPVTGLESRKWSLDQFCWLPTAARSNLLEPENSLITSIQVLTTSIQVLTTGNLLWLR